MNIRQIHAHFLISIGNYSNERIGFTVELDEGENPVEVVESLRQTAREIVGKSADDLYQEKGQLEYAINELQRKLGTLRKEWDATAEFLKAQGINPCAPSMPQFDKLLAATQVEHESVIQGEVDYDDIPI